MTFAQLLPWIYAFLIVFGSGLVGTVILLMVMGMPEQREVPPCPEAPTIPQPMKVDPKEERVEFNRKAYVARRMSRAERARMQFIQDVEAGKC